MISCMEMVGVRRNRGAPPCMMPLAAVLTAALLAPVPAVAQTVTVQVRNEGTAEPIVGAVVHLVSQTGVSVKRALTDERGRVLFFGFGPGRYVLRAEMIGMATRETEAFVAPPGRTTERELALSPRPVTLQGISVDATARCRVGPTNGLVTARLWDEARKALTAAAITDERAVYRFQTLIYERDVTRDTRVIEGERRSRREANMRTPFRSPPIEQLVANGFMESRAGVDTYYAPDAHVLLSDLFLESHCFRARVGDRGESDGLIGLAFEPTPDRRSLVEVTGTLWLDAESSELRWLEYRYENLDPEIRSDELGGHVEFRHMPDGGWIVSNWWIRMPRAARQLTLRGDEMRTFVAGFREAGGMVLGLQEAGRPLGHPSLLGGVEGVVRENLGAPLSGARVEVVGTDRTTVTDATGAFTMRDLIEGVYQLRVVDERLEAYGFAPEPITRAVFDGEMSYLEFRIPSAERVLAEACANVPSVGSAWGGVPPQAQGTGVLVGRVLDDETGEPVGGALVRVLTYRYDFRPGASVPPGQARGHYVKLGNVDPNHFQPIVLRNMYGLEVMTDLRGFYRVCRLPERELLTVVAVHGGVETRGDTLKIVDPGGVREHIVRIRR
jgi:hypothetical protein